MVVVYLYGLSVFAQVSIKYVLKSFAQLDEAIRLISEELNLSFELSINSFGYKVFNCTNDKVDIKIIAESTKVL